MAHLFRPAALFVFVPVVAFGADLGRLTLMSRVGEPLRAEIEILSVQPNEATSLAARIPPPEVFWRANLEPPPLIDHLRARVERRPKGRHVVTLSSTKPVESPFIQILVELDSVAGLVVREYPFLLEESGATPTFSAAAIATAPNVPQRRPADGAVDGTYTVRPGDTLAGIARATKPDDVTVEQTMVALFQANETAFIDGNMNRMSAGTVLALPPDGASRAIGPAEARQIIRLHSSVVPQSSQGAGGAGTTTGEGAKPAKPAGAPVDPQQPPGDQLRLARLRESGSDGGSSDSAHGDDIVALQRALADAQSRIELLQRDLEDVRRLLALKGEQLGSVYQPERSSPELPGRMGEDAAAAERSSEGRNERRDAAQACSRACRLASSHIRRRVCAVGRHAGEDGARVAEEAAPPGASDDRHDDRPASNTATSGDSLA